MRKFSKMFRMLVPSVITFSLVSSPSAAMVNSSSRKTEASSSFESGVSLYEFRGLPVAGVSLSPGGAAFLLWEITSALFSEFRCNDKSNSDRIFKFYANPRTVVMKNLLDEIDVSFVCDSSSFDDYEFLKMFEYLEISYFYLDGIIDNVKEDFPEKPEFKEIQKMIGEILNNENVRSRAYRLQNIKKDLGNYEPSWEEFF